MREWIEVVGFNGGEVDERALARVDLEGYQRCAEIMLNVSLSSQGGMELAPGTAYIGNTPEEGVAILRPWIFAPTTAYAIELSDELLRFVFDGAIVQLDGGAATVGAFSDESAAPSPGGATPEPGDYNFNIGDIGAIGIIYGYNEATVIP